jgi:hypothetical protein
LILKYLKKKRRKTMERNTITVYDFMGLILEPASCEVEIWSNEANAIVWKGFANEWYEIPMEYRFAEVGSFYPPRKDRLTINID